MRLVPIVTAFLVMAFMYYVVVERDALQAFASNGGDAETVAASDDEMAATGADAAHGEDKPDIGVIAIRSTAKSLDSAVILRGETKAMREVEVRAETSGQVISEPLRKGAFVETGQLLCQLDPGTREASLTETRARLLEARARVPESEARLVEAEARLEEALINFNAASKLSEGGFASETRVAAAEANVQAARAGVEAARSGLQSTTAGIESAAAAVAAAEREIKRLSVTAPFGGLLESDTAELGSLMQPGALCATVIQLDPVKVVGFVPEMDVGRVTLGAMAGARLSTGQEVVGQVSFIARSADPTTRTFTVEIEVANTDLAIRAGQTAEIAIAAEGRDAHLVPQSALTLNDRGTLGVRIVADENKVAFVPVSLMRDSTSGVWIDGLPAQADIIIIGQEFVTEGVRVAPSYQEPEQ